MSSELSNEQHADQGPQEEVRGISADNTARNRQLETKGEHGQFGGEATNAGETIQGDGSGSEHWSSIAEPYTSFRQDDVDDEKNPFESRNGAAAEAAEEESIRQVGAIFSTLEGNRMGGNQPREQNSGTINTSTAQSAGPRRDERT